MYEKNLKTNYKKDKKRLDVLKHLKILLLNLSFVMIYIILKVLVLLTNLKVIFWNAFIRSIIESYFSFKKIIFS